MNCQGHFSEWIFCKFTSIYNIYAMIFCYRQSHLSSSWIIKQNRSPLTRIFSPKTHFMSYFLLTLLLYFLFTFHLTPFILPDFPFSERTISQISLLLLILSLDTSMAQILITLEIFRLITIAIILRDLKGVQFRKPWNHIVLLVDISETI